MGHNCCSTDSEPSYMTGGEHGIGGIMRKKRNSSLQGIDAPIGHGLVLFRDISVFLKDHEVKDLKYF